MTIYVFDHDLKKVVEKGTRLNEREDTRPTPMIISDVTPFISPVDKTILGSRADIREHNKRNNVVSVGNDFNNMKPKDFKQNDYLN